MDNSNEDKSDVPQSSETEGKLTPDEEWDAARLKGWHKIEWEDRTSDGPPEPKPTPWYYWAIIAVMAIGMLLPLLIGLLGVFL